MAKDFRGNPINVGDLVIIPHTQANTLILGEVLSISRQQCRIKCLQGHELVGKDFRGGKIFEAMPTRTYRNHEHCCVIT